ncbi:phosphopantetheine-binding protein [Streptomyces longispororuber]|uniref:phosphopantetheine-binding protein n=1 Tax=Streptomyces longispororuber TaxID=68230 RepID=UPI0021092388|nr:phosphopantetheine-binding protein [Streptomyces longispororuber]MCQ4206643.1 phosphopantetheine-binding protein [Streptomyces longispororuber]
MASTEIESWVVDTCRELGLLVEQPGDDFFAGGGNSLTAVRLIAKAEERFGEDSLMPDDLFERSTVQEIAATIQASRDRSRVLD